MLKKVQIALDRYIPTQFKNRIQVNSRSYLRYVDLMRSLSLIGYIYLSGIWQGL